MPRPYYSIVIDAPVDEVWPVIRDFAGISRWHPNLRGSHLTRGGSGAEISARRRFDVPAAGDAHVLEELNALDDQQYVQTFTMLEGWPVHDSSATLHLRPIISDGTTFVEWWAQLEVDPGTDPDALAASVIDVIFRPGLESLRARFSTGHRVAAS